MSMGTNHYAVFLHKPCLCEWALMISCSVPIKFKGNRAGKMPEGYPYYWIFQGRHLLGSSWAGGGGDSTEKINWLFPVWFYLHNKL